MEGNAQSRSIKRSRTPYKENQKRYTSCNAYEGMAINHKYEENGR